MIIDKIYKSSKEEATEDFDCEIGIICKERKIKIGGIYYSCLGYHKNDCCLYHSMMCGRCYLFLKFIE